MTINSRKLYTYTAVAIAALASTSNAGTLPVPDNNCNDVTYDFTHGTTLPADWTATWGGQNVVMTGTNLGMKLTLFNDAITLANNKIQMKYGSISAIMRASNVPGVVTDTMLVSPNDDEIDIEFVGKDTSHMQSNFFYQGILSYGVYGGIHPVANVDTTFHNYTVNWTPTEITWYIDDQAVRTWTKAGAYSDTYKQVMYPTETSQIRLGVWGHNGEWSGGPVNWANYPNGAPVYFQSISVRCYNNTGKGILSTSSVPTTTSSAVIATSTGSASNVTSTKSASSAATGTAIATTTGSASSAASGTVIVTSTKSASSAASGTAVTTAASYTTAVQSSQSSATVIISTPSTSSTDSAATGYATASVGTSSQVTPTRKACKAKTTTTSASASPTPQNITSAASLVNQNLAVNSSAVLNNKNMLFGSLAVAGLGVLLL